jgi:hypothetical protein
VYWQAELSCTTSTYSFTKNSSTEASGGGTGGDSGSFTCVVGDTLVAENTSGIKGIGCDIAASAIDSNAGSQAADIQSGFNVSATSIWTVTPGTTVVYMYAGLIA